jgi:hypothetical protein
MKDFYDVAELATVFPFDGEELAAAIRATCERRGNVLPAKTPAAFTAAFFDDGEKRAQWSGFVRRAGVRNPPTLTEAARRVERFAMPPLMAAQKARTFGARWPAGGPWADAV